MVEKLNLLEDINKLKGRHVEMLKDPEARKIRKNLSTSDYESDTDTNSDDDAVNYNKYYNFDVINFLISFRKQVLSMVIFYQNH